MGDGFVHGEQPAHPGEDLCGSLAAAEVADGPGCTGGGFVPLHESRDVVVGKMMGEQGTDGYVRGSFQLCGEDIAGEPGDGAG